MFISGMITHGAFMLTLVLHFSFVLSSVCFHSFLFSLYIRLYRISHIMYIIFWCFPFPCCTKLQMCPLGYFFPYVQRKMFSLFCFQWTTHTTPNHWRQIKNCSAFYSFQWNEQKSGTTFQRSFQNILRIFHNMGNLIFYNVVLFPIILCLLGQWAKFLIFRQKQKKPGCAHLSNTTIYN